MISSEEVEETRQATKEALGLNDEDVSYVTAELIEELETSASEGLDEVVDESGRALTEAEAISCRPQTFGNRLVFRPGVVFYKQGDPGSVPSFACGTKHNRRWGAQPGDRFDPIGRCGTSGLEYYKLCRPGF